MARHREHSSEHEGPASAAVGAPLSDGVESAAVPDNPLEARIAELEQKIQTLTDDKTALHDQVLRGVADFQNFRKRSQQDALMLRKMATAALVTDLLPVMDNFRRTMDAASSGASLEAILVGIEAVERQFSSVLEANNVSRIEAQGAQFDPEFHEAIGHEHTDDHPEGTVVAEVEPGYRMSDLVIRPARVRVAKRK